MLSMQAERHVDGQYTLLVDGTDGADVFPLATLSEHLLNFRATQGYRVFSTLQELVDYVRHLERVETNREALAWAETLAPTIWQHRNRAWWRLEMVIKRRRKELFGHV
jgi:hypothetical protein